VNIHQRDERPRGARIGQGYFRPGGIAHFNGILRSRRRRGCEFGFERQRRERRCFDGFYDGGISSHNLLIRNIRPKLKIFFEKIKNICEWQLLISCNGGMDASETLVGILVPGTKWLMAPWFQNKYRIKIQPSPDVL
jgi:hypothetical protein